jgi:hypothetical protein
MINAYHMALRMSNEMSDVSVIKPNDSRTAHRRIRVRTAVSTRLLAEVGEESLHPRLRFA